MEQPVYLTAEARKERAWLSYPVRVIAVNLEKTGVPLSSFQNIVFSCSSGMPHILKLLPRAKNRAQAISPLQPRSFLFKVAPLEIKWALFVCTPFITKSWSSPPGCEFLEGKPVSSLSLQLMLLAKHRGKSRYSINIC